MSGPYAYAREVAMRIAERPGATARELYRLFGDRFHEWNYDGHQAANVIAQHLSKFEEDGLVISEKKGKERSAPRTWTWVGPAVMPTVEEVTAEPTAEIHPDDASRVVRHGDLLDPADDLDRALITVRQAARAMARPPIDRRDEKIACLEKLAAITSPDIASLLNEIAEDLA